jgi:hypothetical protein
MKTNTSPSQFWPPDDVPMPGLSTLPPPDGGEKYSPEPRVGAAWIADCEWRFRDAVMILEAWEHGDLTTGSLGEGKSSDGATVIGYYLGRSANEWYLAEVASARPIPNREWVSTFGDVKRPGRASLFGEHDGHAARLTASSADPFKRESFFSAFMPAIKDCVGDERGVTRINVTLPPPELELEDGGPQN